MKTTIAQTMISLLESKDYADITVSMICAHVPVSRTAFYRYFRDKDDVLFYYVAKEFEEKCLPVFRFHLQEKGTLCFFSYISENRALYTKLYHLDEGVLLFRALKYAYRRGFERRAEYSNPVNQKYLSFNPEVFYEYSTSGIAAVVIKWIGNDLRPSQEQMARDLYIMLSEPLSVVRDYYT